MFKHITLTFCLSLSCLAISAQTEAIDSLMQQAFTYSQQKEYMKSDECLEKAVSMLPSVGGESLIPTIRESQALNYINLGKTLLLEKKYVEAKPYFDKAIEYSRQESKVFKAAHRWAGAWYSRQALDLHLADNNLEQALTLYKKAEQHYNQASAQEKRLSTQLSQAAVLHDLQELEASDKLLRQIISECEAEKTFEDSRAIAFYLLGSNELEEEEYQTAIEHLEQGYQLCLATDKTSYAKLAARKLAGLYKTALPVPEKAELWQHRADESN